MADRPTAARGYVCPASRILHCKILIIFAGFDFDAFLRDSPPDANKLTNASGAPVASVAPPPVPQMNETDVETKQCTREDKNVSRLVPAA